MKAPPRDAFTCGICGTDLQPLDPSTQFHGQALAQLEAWDIRPTSALLALTAHIMYVHDDVVDPPGFPPM